MHESPNDAVGPPGTTSMPRASAEKGVQLEWLVAVALTVFIVACHFIRIDRAGGLWRDEANSVYLASRASVQENWQKIQFDSFPVGWFVVLRAWNTLGLGDTDFSWRTLGFLVGIANVTLLWLASRVMSVPGSSLAPATALFLVGFCPAATTVGDSMRGYGLGMCCTVASVAATWATVCRPRVRSWMLIAALYTVTVQVSFQAAMAIFAIGSAAAVIGLQRRSAWQALAPLCAGSTAAASLIIYQPVFQDVRNWDFILRQPINLGRLCMNWIDALQVIGLTQWPGMTPLTPFQRLVAATIWLTFAGTGCVLAWKRWCTSKRAPSTPVSDPLTSGSRHALAEIELILFSVICLLVFVPAYLGGLFAFGWMTTARHYLVGIALSGVLIDSILRNSLGQSRRLRSSLAIAVAVASLATGDAVLRGVMIRATNIDLAAKVINDRVAPGDVVLVSPWEIGVSFHRYCNPGVRWFTLPPLEDNSVHRYDLYRNVLRDATYGETTCRFLRSEASTLGNIWYVGSDLKPTAAGQEVLSSFSGGPFSIHAMSCIGSIFDKISLLPPLTNQPVAASEDVSIMLLQR